MSGHDTIAVLAGGLATRMRPLTERVPKALLEVAGEPFIFHQLRLFHRHGLRRVVLLTGYLGQLVEDAVGDGSQFGLSVEYVPDGPVLLGTGGSLMRALPGLPDRFFVTYGDSYLDTDYRHVSSSFEQDKNLALMTLFRNANSYDRSNADLVAGRALYRKNDVPEAWQYIDFGLLYMTQAAFSGAADGPSDLAEILAGLSRRQQLQGLEVGERFYEIGSPAGLAETSQHLSGKG